MIPLTPAKTAPANRPFAKQKQEIGRARYVAAGARFVQNNSVRFKHRSDSPLKKKARRGFRGFPAATIAFYGPDDKRASKVAIGIVVAEGAEPVMERLFTEDGDARTDPAIGASILRLLQDQGVKSVIMTDGIIGCPHEEGIDYPDGQVCPQCPFWAHRNRWTGEIEQ
jgi:hypothetical protein